MPKWKYDKDGRAIGVTRDTIDTLCGDTIDETPDGIKYTYGISGKQDYKQKGKKNDFG